MGKLMVGDSGRPVRRLQRWLNDVGYGVPTNGDFTPNLQEVVKDFQELAGLLADGQVGRRTKVALKRLRRKIRRGERQKISQRAVETGIPPAILAVMEFEVEELDFDDELVTNPITPGAKSATEAKSFSNIREAESAFDALSRELSGRDLKAAQAYMRQKALLDIFGEAPMPDQMDEILSLINSNSWLEPEGRDFYMKYYLLDSPNHFQGGDKEGGVFYHYKVTRSGSRYLLNVKKVANGRSNLVFSTHISTETSGDSITAKVYFAENKVYKWDEDRNSYLQGTLTRGQENIALGHTGQMQANHRGRHNHNDALEDHEFTDKNIIRSVLHCLIHEYTGVFA